MAIFARAPRPGRGKTRLIPLLGLRGAASFQAALLSDAIRKVDSLRPYVAPYLFLMGGERIDQRSFPANYTLVRQRGADLGERLARAFRQLLNIHSRAVVIGTDSPTMPPGVLHRALRELHSCDAVLGPCPDGGYYLIGLRRLSARLFRGIRWGTAFAFRDTLRRLLEGGFICSILSIFRDVDRPSDLQWLRRKLARNRAARGIAASTWRFLKKDSGLRLVQSTFVSAGAVLERAPTRPKRGKSSRPPRLRFGHRTRQLGRG